MKRSLKIHLRWISIVIMLGCATGYTQEKVTCKATISFHGQELSGRMMFKKVAEDTVRFAFFNELGMSFVEGSVAVRSSQFAVRSRRPALKAEPEGSAVGGQRSAVSSQDESANGKRQTANGKRPNSNLQISDITPFLDYRTFVKHLEKGLVELLLDKESGDFVLPALTETVSREMIYRRGNKFILKLVL